MPHKWNPLCSACGAVRRGVGFTDAERARPELHPLSARIRCHRCGAPIPVGGATRWRLEGPP